MKLNSCLGHSLKIWILFGHNSQSIGSPEPKASSELIGWDLGWCLCVSVHASTLSNIYTSVTGRLIIIKFHLEHYLGKGLAALGFGPDWIRILVSMSTDNSYRVIMGKTFVTTLALSF